MKHVKLFENFRNTKNPRYKTPEYEFKEFYRAFRNFEELRELIPSDVDQSIFDVIGSGFDNEPEWLDAHVDPPSREGEIDTAHLISIAREEDPRFIPFIKWCQGLLLSCKMNKIPLENVRKGLSSNFKNHDWGLLEKDPDYLDNCEKEYNKAINAGLDDYTLGNTLGLVKKYPDIIINKAQFWMYIKGSINHFNHIEESGGELPCTQFIMHNGNYYTIGGRRRMFWHFYNKIDPTVCLINL